MSTHHAMRHRMCVIESGMVAGHLENTLDGAGRGPSLHTRITRVDRADAVDSEVVIVNLRFDRSDGYAPDAVTILMERLGIFHEFTGQGDSGRCRSSQAEGRGAIGCYLR